MIWTLFWWLIIVPTMVVFVLFIVLMPVFWLLKQLSDMSDARQERRDQRDWDRHYPPTATGAVQTRRSPLVP